MALANEVDETPTTSAGWFNYAAQLQTNNDRPGAVEAYRRGGELCDDPIQAAQCYMNITWLMVDELNADAAVAASWRGVALNPTQTTILQMHARALRYAGKTEEAIRFYQAAIDGDPAACGHHWTDLALLRTAQGRYLEALDLVRSHVGSYSMNSLEYKTLLEVSDICLTALEHSAAPITSGFNCPSRAAAAAQWQEFYETSPEFRKFAPVICVGDSHAAFFSGVHTFQYNWPEPSPQWLPHVSGHYVASALAYSLNRENTSVRGIEKLQTFLRSKELVRGSTLMLSFGEIDLRNHVIGQSLAQSRPVAEIVDNCVTAYRHAVELVLSAGFRVMIWGPPPSRIENGAYPQMFPTTGTEVERNAATRLFIEGMRAAMAPLGVPVVSIFDEMISSDLRTDGRYFMDSCHLNMAATPLAIAAMRRALQHKPD